MNRKGLLLLALAAAAAAQLAVPAWMIVGRELTLRDGVQFKFRTRPVDPADAFRGRYVLLGLEPDHVTVSNASQWASGARAYAVLSTDADGFAEVLRLDRTPPPVELAIPVRVGWSVAGTNGVHFSWPLDRYYMEETRAPAAEAAYRSHSTRTNRTCHVTVRVRGRDAVLEGLFIDGKPIREFLKKP